MTRRMNHTLPDHQLLVGEPETLRRSWDAFQAIPVDHDRLDETTSPAPERASTIEREVSVEGPGTFLGKAIRKVTFAPTHLPGWWFDRTDLPEALPVKVSIRNVWTTGAVVSNIVLRSGSPHNYIRLVEHIIALRYGFGVDNLMIKIDSGDPPLFDRGNLDLVEALDRAGRVESETQLSYYTVRKPVALATPEGKFLVFEPAKDGDKGLYIDCAIDFPNAIGKQRIRFPVNESCCRLGAEARTNTTLQKMLYCKTVGKLFADIRNLGYTGKNVLIAGKFGYVNEANILHNDKSLEAVWHRAVLDLLAAVALIDEGRLAGTITSYKAGHAIDVQMVRHLYTDNMLVKMG